MHLIAPLMTGVRGAKNGTVFCYERGTVTPAPLYADASGKVRRFGAIRLDALGSVSLYVDRLVDVAVYDAHAALVREWTDGRADGAVVVESDAFTGVNFETGVSAVGERTTLAEALARAITSFGAVDWNVLVELVAYPMYVAIGAVAGLFFDPRSFGAQGDGLTDDLGSIQAAIDTAREAGGGIVYLKAGTYLVSAALVLYYNVSLVGDGAGSTSIVSTSTVNPVMYMLGGDDPSAGSAISSHSVSGIRFAAKTSSSRELVQMYAGNATITACAFDGTFTTGDLLIINLASNVTVDACTFVVVAPTTIAINTLPVGGAGTGVYASRCVFVAPAEHTVVSGLVGPVSPHMDGCVFDVTASTSGDILCASAVGIVHAVMDGCEVTAAAGATPVLLALGNLNQLPERVFEDCSLIENSGTTRLYALTDSNAASIYYCRLKTADARHAPLAVDTTLLNSNQFLPIVPDASQYGVFSIINGEISAEIPADSGIVVGAATDMVYAGNVPLGRAVDVLFFSRGEETFDLDENLALNSSMPSFSMTGLAERLFAFRMLAARVHAQWPSVGERTKLCCIAHGGIGVSGPYPFGYKPI